LWVVDPLHPTHGDGDRQQSIQRSFQVGRLVAPLSAKGYDLSKCVNTGIGATSVANAHPLADDPGQDLLQRLLNGGAPGLDLKSVVICAVVFD
jgi:hypothetical protein